MGEDADAGPERFDQRIVDLARRPTPKACGRQVCCTVALPIIDLDRTPATAGPYDRAVATDATVTASPGPRGLGGLTPSGRAIVPISWALYDFANTIFSFAVVSGAIGLWLTDDARFGERDGNAFFAWRSSSAWASTRSCRRFSAR